MLEHLLILCTTLLFCYIKYSTSANLIGLIIKLHNGSECTSITTESVQHILAAEWAVNIINIQGLNQNNIELELIDVCDKSAVQEITKNNTKLNNYIGFISHGNQKSLLPSLRELSNRSLPLIVTSPHFSDLITNSSNILATSPQLFSLINPTTSLLQELKITHVTLITSCDITTKKFPEDAQKKGIKISQTLYLTKNLKFIGEVVKRFLDEESTDFTIVFILEPEELKILGEFLEKNRIRKSKSTTIISTIGMNKNLIKLCKSLFANSYLIEYYTPELPTFKEYLLDNLKNSSWKYEFLLKTYFEQLYQCNWNNSSPSKSNCQNIVTKTSDIFVDPEVIFIVKAVSVFSASFTITNNKDLNTCKETVQQCILNILLKSSFGNYKLLLSQSLDENGNVEFNKFIILHIGRIADMVMVGWYTEEKGLVIDKSQTSLLQLQSNSKQHDVEFNNNLLKFNENNAIVHISKIYQYSFISSPFASLVFAISAAGLIITIFILLYVCYKIFDGTLTGNQSLGIILLFVLLVIYLSTTLSIPFSYLLKCSTKHLIYSISFVICYGILLVKVMQLRSLVLLGLGGRISFTNLYLVLFFIVLVQVVLCFQLVITRNFSFFTKFDNCFFSNFEFLTLHSYSCGLSFITFLYGLSIIKIKRNYQEAKWIIIASGLSSLIILHWCAIFIFAPNQYHDVTTYCSVLTLATILIISIFIPKIGTIAKQNIADNQKIIQITNPVFSSNNNAPELEKDQKDTIFQNPIFLIKTSAFP